MKKCTYCGKGYPDSATVCSVDQQPLVSDDESLMSPAASVVPSPKPPSPSVPGVRPKPALMVRLRLWHLYLGCFFAPMLLYFTISGIWQTMGLRRGIFATLSSVHTAHKGTGPVMKIFVLLMALCFILTTILGIAMAVTQGRNRKLAYCCLVLGVVIPVLLLVIPI